MQLHSGFGRLKSGGRDSETATSVTKERKHLAALLCNKPLGLHNFRETRRSLLTAVAITKEMFAPYKKCASAIESHAVYFVLFLSVHICFYVPCDLTMYFVLCKRVVSHKHILCVPLSPRSAASFVPTWCYCGCWCG